MRIKAVYSVFLLRMKNIFQYRTAAWAGLSTQFAWGFMFMMLYTAFYKSGMGTSAMALPDLLSYSWLRQAFLALMNLWMRDGDIDDMIVSGQVAYELCRPVNIYDLWFARLSAQRLASAAMRCWPILIVASLLPVGMRLNPPASALSLLLFISALAGGLLVIVALAMLVYSTIFKTMSPSGSFGIVSVLVDFLSGTYIPLPLLPDSMEKALYFLPFSYIADFPLRVWSGNITPIEALPMIGIQLFWFVLLMLLGRYVVGRSLKNVTVMGG